MNTQYTRKQQKKYWKKRRKDKSLTKGQREYADWKYRTMFNDEYQVYHADVSALNDTGASNRYVVTIRKKGRNLFLISQGTSIKIGNRFTRNYRHVLNGNKIALNTSLGDSNVKNGLSQDLNLYNLINSTPMNKSLSFDDFKKVEKFLFDINSNCREKNKEIVTENINKKKRK